MRKPVKRLANTKMLSLIKIESTSLKNKKLLIFVILLILMFFIFIIIQSQINTLDKFGIKELYRTTSGDREWFSTWDNGHARSWTDQSNDPYDPEFWTQHKGSGSWSTNGKGILSISGSTPRMYIVHRNSSGHWYGYWRNVEITVYGKRVADRSISYGGIMAFARTNHEIETNYCDTRGYGGRFKYDGNIDFDKEIKHGTSYAQVSSKNYWSGGMIKKAWIGYKYIVRDDQNGNVKLELYIDTTDGLDGGNWIKVNEFTDNGTNFGVGYTPCTSDIDPALRLTSSDNRLGSESGTPNLDVYFRSDGVSTNGLLFKKASVREIDPITSSPIPVPLLPSIPLLLLLHFS